MQEIANLTEVPWMDMERETDVYRVYFDGFPVTAGHRLFVPKDRLSQEALARCFSAANIVGLEMVRSGKAAGFNIGMNRGDQAGQTIGWPHVHLIPRYIGDCADPTGGVRGVIHEQQNYHSDDYHRPH